MKCNCDACGGKGVVECECFDCDGEGTLSVLISETDPPEGHPHFDELMEIRKQVKAVGAAAARLIEMKPEHAESYRAQLTETFAKLEAEAEAIVNPEDVYL